MRGCQCGQAGGRRPGRGWSGWGGRHAWKGMPPTGTETFGTGGASGTGGAAAGLPWGGRWEEEAPSSVRRHCERTWRRGVRGGTGRGRVNGAPQSGRSGERGRERSQPGRQGHDVRRVLFAGARASGGSGRCGRGRPPPLSTTAERGGCPTYRGRSTQARRRVGCCGSREMRCEACVWCDARGASSRHAGGRGRHTIAARCHTRLAA